MKDSIVFTEPIDPIKVSLFLADNIGNHLNFNTFTWEYKNTPSPSLFRIVESESGEILASQGFVSISLTNPKTNISFLTGKSESTFAKKELRGQGVYEKFYLQTLELACNRGISFFWGFTFISDYFYKKLGYNKVDNAIVTVLVTLSLKKSIANSINSKKSIRSKIKKILDAFKHTSFSTRRFESSTLVNSVSYKKASEDFQTLLTINSQKYTSLCCVLYDLNYFEWRFESNPICKYEYVSLFDNGNLVSSAVINVTSSDTAIITDVVFHHEYSLQALVSSLLEDLRIKGFAGVEFYANKTNSLLLDYIKALQTIGGKVYPNPFLKFVYRNEGAHSILMEDLYITGSWTEGFRI
jgi:hypothetical protein